MLPASLRAGMMTETRSGRSSRLVRGSMRATVRVQRSKRRNPGSGASQRLTRLETRGTGSGRRMEGFWEMMSKSHWRRRPATS